MSKQKITQDHLLKAVISIADDKGLRHTTLKDVAEFLHIKTPSLYNHCDGIDDLYKMLANFGLKRLKEALREAAIGLSKNDALFAMGHAYRKFVNEYPSMYEATQWVEIWKDKEGIRLSDEIIAIISKVLSSYDLSEVESIHTIRLLRSYLHGFSTLEQHGGLGMDTSIEDSFNVGLNLIIGNINQKFGDEKND